MDSVVKLREKEIMKNQVNWQLEWRQIRPFMFLIYSESSLVLRAGGALFGKPGSCGC